MLDSAAIIAWKREEERRMKAQRRQSKNWMDSTQARVGMLVFALLILVLYGVMFGTSPRGRPMIVLIQAGDFGGPLTESSFVDPNGLLLFNQVLGNLTAQCIPAPSDPSMANAKSGLSRAATNAAWFQIMTAIQGNVTNTTEGCYLYGLLAAQFRTDQPLGPVDICHGYVHVGVDLFHQLYNFSIPPNIGTLLLNAYELAYPLNLFWQNTPNANTTRQLVVSQAYQLILCLTTPSPACVTPTGIDIRYMATQFCNQYFAADDPTYYSSGLQPWLSFPFPGLMQRNGSNIFAMEARKLLSLQFLINIVNQTIGETLPLKGVYIAGDVLSTTPGMTTVLDALTGTVPRYYQPTGMTIPDYLSLIRQNLQQLDAGETLLVVGRYAEDIVTYNSQNFITNSYPTPAFFLFSNIITDPSEFQITPANRGLLSLELRNFATSWQVMNMVDFTTQLAFDLSYSTDYNNEKYAAQYLTLISNAFFNINMNETMQLLDSFALKNVMINGVDFGGHIQALVQQNILDNQDLSVGYQEFAADFNGQVNVRVDAFGANAPDLPATYDLRTDPTRKHLLAPVRDQGSCQDCWCESVVQSQKTRFPMFGKTPNTGPAPISIAHVTGCSGDNINGCAANHPITALTFLSLQGAVDELCFPTTTIKCSGPYPCAEPVCQKNCKQNWMEFKDDASLYYKVSGTEAWKAEVYQNGPFSSCFYMPTNFAAFYANPANKLKCYSDETTVVSGGHCVESLGWDTENLFFRNTWGPDWGNNGDFCVKANMARIQKTKWFTNEAWAAIPGGVTNQNVKVVIPATDNRQVQNALNTNGPTQQQLVPQPLPTPKPIPPRPSAAIPSRPSAWWVFAMCVLTMMMIV